jgi:hypothetical protein
MRTIWILGSMAILVACASHHGAHVSCDGKLRPINSPLSQAASPLADAATTKVLDGAP